MGHSEKHIAPLVVGGIIAAGASLAGNAIGSYSQRKTNQTSIDINRENNAFNAQQAQIQRDWQKFNAICPKKIETKTQKKMIINLKTRPISRYFLNP